VVKAPALADLAVVLYGAYWLRGYAKRAALRDTLSRAKQLAPAQYELVKRVLPEPLANLEAGESPVVPLVIGTYAMLRLRGGRRCR
jgi:hypothetical protein